MRRVALPRHAKQMGGLFSALVLSLARGGDLATHGSITCANSPGDTLKFFIGFSGLALVRQCRDYSSCKKLRLFWSASVQRPHGS